MDLFGRHRWWHKRYALVTVVACAATVNIAWFSIWYHRTHEPGRLIFRAFKLRLLSAGGPSQFTKFSVPNKVTALRMRRVPALRGMMVALGSYHLRVPPGTTQVSVGIFHPAQPMLGGPVTYRGRNGAWHEGREVLTNGKFLTVPGGWVAIRLGSVEQRVRCLVPAGAAAVNAPLRGNPSIFFVLVNTPHWHLLIGRGGNYPRATLGAFLSHRHYAGGVYSGFSMARWCRVLVQCGVKPAAARGVMLRIIHQHLANETDLQIEKGMLRATWGVLKRHTRLGPAVWTALELQFRMVPDTWNVLWAHLPGGRTMVLCGLQVFVFNPAGRATLEGQGRWRRRFLPADIQRVVIPFYAQAAPPRFWQGPP